jgi:uncharacterized metal-binding protein YceD (DUF177 family)
MIIEVKKLITARKYQGTLDFEVTPQKEQLLVPLTEFAGNIKVHAEYEIFDDDSVQVKLKLNYILKGQCSYCLKDVEKEIEFFDDVLFVPEESDEDYEYDGIKINLKTAVDDAILFSQPNVLLCSEDCKGIDTIIK